MSFKGVCVVHVNVCVIAFVRLPACKSAYIVCEREREMCGQVVKSSTELILLNVINTVQPSIHLLQIAIATFFYTIKAFCHLSISVLLPSLCSYVKQ